MILNVMSLIFKVYLLTIFRLFVSLLWLLYRFGEKVLCQPLCLVASLSSAVNIFYKTFLRTSE